VLHFPELIKLGPGVVYFCQKRGGRYFNAFTAEARFTHPVKELMAAGYAFDGIDVYGASEQVSSIDIQGVLVYQADHKWEVDIPAQPFVKRPAQLVLPFQNFFASMVMAVAYVLFNEGLCAMR